MTVNELIHKGSASPKSVFMVDAAGAAVSAIMLGFVLPRLEAFFGIPVSMLYVLAIPPLFFLVFDLIVITNPRFGLKGLRLISQMNAAYCILSIVLLFSHLSTIQPLGLAYLIGEVILVLGIAWIEWQVYQRLKTTS